MNTHELHEIIFPRLFAALSGRIDLTAQAHDALDELSSLPVSAWHPQEAGVERSRRIEDRLSAVIDAAQQLAQPVAAGEGRASSIGLRDLARPVHGTQAAHGRRAGEAASASELDSLLAEVRPLAREVVLVVQRHETPARARQTQCDSAAGSRRDVPPRRRLAHDVRHAARALATGALS